MATQRRCPTCREWYDKNDGACPECDEPPARFNKWLATARLDGQLHEQVRKAEKERDYARRVGLDQ